MKMKMNKFLYKIAKDKIHPDDKELIDFVTDPTMPGDTYQTVYPGAHEGKYANIVKKLLNTYRKEFGKDTRGRLYINPSGAVEHAINDPGNDNGYRLDQVSDASKTLLQLHKLRRELGGVDLALDSRDNSLEVFPMIPNNYEDDRDQHDYQSIVDTLTARAPKNFDKLHLTHRWYGKDADDFGVDSYAVVKGKKVPLDISEKDLDKYENTMRRLRLRQKFKKLNYSIDPEGNYEAEYKY